MLKELTLKNGAKVRVSDAGEVFSVDHKGIRKNGRPDNRKGKRLSPKINKYGYECVVLTNNGIRENHCVHSLIAKAFIENPDNKPTVNHIDGDKRNNRVSNLEWADWKEQKVHAWENGLVWNKRDSLGRFIKKGGGNV